MQVASQPGMVAGYNRAVLTPNQAELAFLLRAAKPQPGPAAPAAASGPSGSEGAGELARLLGRVTVVAKGEVDTVTDGVTVVACDTAGSPRRCEGQGHILAGATATFLHWAGRASLPPTTAAWAGAHLVRTAAHAAFAAHGRACSAQERTDRNNTTTTLVGWLVAKFGCKLFIT